ncbi:MAG: hypothetical protein PUC23_02695 [bacterium]|nr:hypothetical protein [bacterium]
MIYVYDVVLNLNNTLVEFFEWEEKDNIKYVRKIPFYKINEKTMNDFIKNNVKVEEEFIEKLYDKAKLEDNYDDEYKYLSLFTDGNLILGVLFTKDGKNKLISRLLLDEEDEILLLGNRLTLTNIDYNIIDSKKNNNTSLTRNEFLIKTNLEKEFKTLYNNNLVDKLNYFYFEYFNKINNNKELCYKELIDSLNNNFNKKHVNLYDIIKLSYEHK